MSKKAVCIGINDYPGTNNDLNGCVNDMHDWANLLTGEFGFDAVTMADSAATADAILDALASLVDGSSAGDSLALTFSGHGTYILDGTDADESDNYDEAICAHDRNIVDDEIRGIIDRLPPGAFLTVISDSCHSGTVTRAILDRAGTAQELAEPDYPTLARYMPLDNHKKFDTAMVPTRHRAFGSAANMNHVLLTGCAAVELSYDAWINGRYNGAMSANSISIIRQDPSVTYDQLHAKLGDVLPSRYFPQTPQLEGPASLRSRQIFS